MSAKQRQAKRAQPAKKIERQGVALIAKTVADMGHLWNEPQNDFGTASWKWASRSTQANSARR